MIILRLFTLICILSTFSFAQAAPVRPTATQADQLKAKIEIALSQNLELVRELESAKSTRMVTLVVALPAALLAFFKVDSIYRQNAALLQNFQLQWTTNLTQGVGASYFYPGAALLISAAGATHALTLQTWEINRLQDELIHAQRRMKFAINALHDLAASEGSRQRETSALPPAAR